MARPVLHGVSACGATAHYAHSVPATASTRVVSDEASSGSTSDTLSLSADAVSCSSARLSVPIAILRARMRTGSGCALDDFEYPWLCDYAAVEGRKGSPDDAVDEGEAGRHVCVFFARDRDAIVDYFRGRSPELTSASECVAGAGEEHLVHADSARNLSEFCFPALRENFLCPPTSSSLPRLPPQKWLQGRRA